jgi:hypothetical protein
VKNVSRHRIASALGSILAVAAVASAAQAQEYCVTCSDPPATYRCILNVSKPQGLPLKVLCITTLARQGGHASCSVRGGTVFDCPGEIRHVSAADAPAGQRPAPQAAPPEAGAPARPAPPPALPPEKSAQPPAPQPVAPAPKEAAKQAKKGEPQTLEDLAKEVGSSSGKTLKKAGEAVQGATSKAWNCLKTLFTGC